MKTTALACALLAATAVACGETRRTTVTNPAPTSATPAPAPTTPPEWVLRQAGLATDLKVGRGDLNGATAQNWVVLSDGGFVWVGYYASPDDAAQARAVQVASGKYQQVWRADTMSVLFSVSTNATPAMVAKVEQALAPFGLRES
jgi:hypothetical protein